MRCAWGNACAVLPALILAATTFAQPPALPPLPDQDGSIEIAAQEWPRQPGPRTVKVYVRYPSGSLASVNSQSGLILCLHNWGGTDAAGAPDPAVLANRFNLLAISLDYLQSGKFDADAGVPYDHGYFQALDALRALYTVLESLKARGIAVNTGRIYATGGSGGGNLSLMVNKLAPRAFACIVDLCGMPKLSDDVAFNLPGGSVLNAAYSADPESPNYLSADAQAIRFIGNPAHLTTMKALGISAKIVVVHGTKDVYCLPEDAREMVENMTAAGLDVDAHFIKETDVDGVAIKAPDHSLGDRTQIVLKYAARYLEPEGPDAAVRRTPSDFDLRDTAVRYETPNGAYVISYADGFPVGSFVPAAVNP
ncbi:MAG: DUF2920 family protein [Candidatus Hydrogenedentes bacterium]|nr:DUF2920 family protein [Candidatus Hydrogenedentota bacterium]